MNTCYLRGNAAPSLSAATPPQPSSEHRSWAQAWRAALLPWSASPLRAHLHGLQQLRPLLTNSPVELSWAVSPGEVRGTGESLRRQHGRQRVITVVWRTGERERGNSVSRRCSQREDSRPRPPAFTKCPLPGQAPSRTCAPSSPARDRPARGSQACLGQRNLKSRTEWSVQGHGTRK